LKGRAHETELRNGKEQDQEAEKKQKLRRETAFNFI
jgi:hypothetical protein